MLVPRMASRVGTMMKSNRSTPAKLLWDLQRSGVSGGGDDQDQIRSNATMQVETGVEGVYMRRGL